MSQVAQVSDSNNGVFIHDTNHANSKDSRFPKIILEGLSQTDRETLIKSWSEKQQSERFQALKSGLSAAAGMVVCGALLYLVLHFFILNSITSYFAFQNLNRQGEMVYILVSAITPLSIAGFGGGLGMIGGGAYAIFDKLIKQHFVDIHEHLHKANHIQEELFRAKYPGMSTAEPVQKLEAGSIETKILSESELKRKRVIDLTKAVLCGAGIVLACAGTAAGVYIVAKVLLIVLINANFRQIPSIWGSVFIQNRYSSIPSVLLTAEFMALSGVALYGIKYAVNKLWETSKDSWNQATVGYAEGLARLKKHNDVMLNFERLSLSAEAAKGNLEGTLPSEDDNDSQPGLFEEVARG